MADTSSHIPAASVYSEGGESVRLRDDLLFCQVDVSMPEVSDKQGEIILLTYNVTLICFIYFDDNNKKKMD